MRAPGHPLLGEEDGANGVSFAASLDGVAALADESDRRRRRLAPLPVAPTADVGVRRRTVALNGTDLTGATPAVRQRVNNGILEYIFVVRRGNWVVPPRSKQALPRPQ